MSVYEGRRIPLIYWDTSGEDYRGLRLSSGQSRSQATRTLDRPTGARLTNQNPMANQTYELPLNFGDLMGAYDEAHWQTQVCEIKAGQSACSSVAPSSQRAVAQTLASSCSSPPNRGSRIWRAPRPLD